MLRSVTRAPMLEPAASFVAKRPVKVYCALDEGKVDCAAARATPDEALRFFGRRRLIVPLLTKELARYRKSKAVYRTVC